MQCFLFAQIIYLFAKGIYICKKQTFEKWIRLQ